ncbi:reverse transcriptase domain-containing protein [Tanacetum coccineum]
MKYQPLYFKGTEGVVELTQWFERMETVFYISNCYMENKIKFSTFTLLAGALAWWNSHVRTIGHDVTYLMTWTDLKKKMTDKYFPRNKMKKIEAELWNLKVKGTDVIGYNQCFQELALLCVRMFPEESDKVERTRGSSMTLPETIRTNNNIDKKTRGRTLAGFTLRDQVKRNNMGDLNLYAQSATITMTVYVLQNATNATKLAILLVTVGVPSMPTLLTTKRALGRVKGLLASSVEFSDTSRGNV